MRERERERENSIWRNWRLNCPSALIDDGANEQSSFLIELSFVWNTSEYTPKTRERETERERFLRKRKGSWGMIGYGWSCG